MEVYVAKAIAPLTVLLSLTVLPGCGPNSDGKFPVQGTVTWNGAPIEVGTIAFFPQATAAPEAGKITDGKFSFACPPGRCRVVIRAERFTGKMIESMNQPQIEQYIPREYNVDSTLTAEVSEDGDNDFTFALVAS